MNNKQIDDVMTSYNVTLPTFQLAVIVRFCNDALRLSISISVFKQVNIFELN